MFPLVSQFRTWQVAHRDGVASVSGCLDDGSRWVLGLEKKLRLDCKLAAALSKVMRGELGRQNK